MKRVALLASSAALVSVTIIAGASMAQHHGRMGPAAGNMHHGMMGQGMPGMMGHGMMMGGHCPMMGMMTAPTDMPAFGEGRVAFLKAELAITPAQTAAWDEFAAALKKSLSTMQGMRQAMMTATSGGSPVERLNAHVTAIESRLAGLKEMKPALEKLYAALGDEQKKKADLLMTSMGCMQ